MKAFLKNHPPMNRVGFSLKSFTIPFTAYAYTESVCFTSARRVTRTTVKLATKESLNTLMVSANAETGATGIG